MTIRLIASLAGFALCVPAAHAQQASEDWQAIARYHTLLAEIYTRNGKWGDLDDPYSAVFQWENAIRAHRRLSGSSPAPIPRLHAALAHCYQEKGDEEKAAENYLTAAEQFLVEGRAAEAEAMVYRTRQLPAERIDAHNLQRLEAVRGAVRLAFEAIVALPPPKSRAKPAAKKPAVNRSGSRPGAAAPRRGRRSPS